MSDLKMDEDTAIEISDVRKCYRIGKLETRPESMFGAFLHVLLSPVRNFKKIRGLTHFGDKQEDSLVWALKGVSLKVKAGEVLGIIGKNGSGKSTMLKILSRITEPTEGEIRMRGRTSSLLEVGTGFHPDMTGRENIYLNGTILGMTKSEIDGKISEIIEFSGVETYIDTPIKRYSSGMKVRLAFAVAAFLEPDILIVDEVLAVGDAMFQKKCIERMEDISEGGKTVLFVSHNMQAVQSMCTRVAVLNEGDLIFEGDVHEGIDTYNKLVFNDTSSNTFSRKNAQGGDRIRIEDLWVNGRNNRLSIGEDIEISIKIKALKGQVDDLCVSYDIIENNGAKVITLHSSFQNQYFSDVDGEVVIDCRLPEVTLVPGQYFININCTIKGGIGERIERASSFYINECDYFGSGRMPSYEKHGKYIVSPTWNRE